MTNPSPRARSTRDRPAKAPLSEDAVVEAALAILKTEGLAAVTMRRVAAELDTGAASLYAYVSGRQGLLQAMEGRITASIGLDAPDPARWRAQLHVLLERWRQVLLAHPGIALSALAEPPTSEATLQLLENLLGILLASGLQPQDAAWAADMFAMVVTYTAIEGEARNADPGELAAGFFERFAALPREQFPIITAHATQLVAGSSDDRFTFAIDVIVDGMLARTRN